MPNAANITAPATLVSYGRSGTSLLQSVFEAHPDYGITGETSELIFGVFHGLQGAEGIVRGPTREAGLLGRAAPSYRERCVQAARAVFLSMFEDDKKHWMQKPIGHAMCRVTMQRAGMTPERYFAWYWDVMGAVFPDARCFTVLRHPCDVVLSGRKYWGRDDATLWNGLEGMASCIVHPDSKVGHAVLYDELVAEPEKVLRALFAYLGTPYHEKVLSALERVWVPRRGVWRETAKPADARVAAGFSRREQWGELDLQAAQPHQVRAVQQWWAKFGYELELPPGLPR